MFPAIARCHATHERQRRRSEPNTTHTERKKQTPEFFEIPHCVGESYPMEHASATGTLSMGGGSIKFQLL